MPNYIKLGNLRIEIPEPANNGGGGGGGGGGEGLLSGLLAFYNLSDPTDASGNNRTLTNNGGVTFSAGKIGNAAVFDGSSDFQLDLNLSQASALSVSFWWMWDQSIDGSNILNGPINAYVYPGDNFKIDLSDGGLNTTVLTNLTTGVWRHCTLVADASGRSVFMDGTMVASNQTPYANYGNVTQNIGRHSDYPSQYQFFGKLDALGLWSRALTSAEITELYNAGTGKEHPFA